MPPKKDEPLNNSTLDIIELIKALKPQEQNGDGLGGLLQNVLPLLGNMGIAPRVPSLPQQYTIPPQAQTQQFQGFPQDQISGIASKLFEGKGSADIEEIKALRNDLNQNFQSIGKIAYDMIKELKELKENVLETNEELRKALVESVNSNYKIQEILEGFLEQMTNPE